MARPVIDGAGALLQHLRDEGFELAAQGNHLRIRPAERVTPELRTELAAHKPALLAALAPARVFVTLKDGPTLPAEAIELALDLERRGIRLRTDAAHQLVVPRHPELTQADYAAIARWRLHLAAIANYSAPIIG